jgi:2-dehydro-3-deoxyphosphogluconate aldolase / (4S)-4-hydroxy-2-oxoglutarate aldolase
VTTVRVSLQATAAELRTYHHEATRSPRRPRPAEPGHAAVTPAPADGAGVLAQLASFRIVPVIVIDDAAATGPLADALAAGGLRCAEVTLRTPTAMAAVSRCAENSGLLVGAGTVLDPDQVNAAADAGARFIVSPGFDAEVVRRCQELGLPVLPGAATPTDIQLARRAGLTAVKFFPAETLGGVTALEAIAAPFPGMTFVPTGGITPRNVSAYLRHRAVLAVGGSWMAPRSLIAAQDWPQISQLAAEAARLAAEFPAAQFPADGAAREARP